MTGPDARERLADTVCENMHCGDSSRCFNCEGCRNYTALRTEGKPS